MTRALHVTIVLAAFVACKADSGPTSPGASSNFSDASALGIRTNVAFNEGGKPHSSNVEALATITHNRGRFRSCDGADGFYVENRQVNTGTVTGDPRLTGTIEMRITELVFFGPPEFHAPSFGTFVIRDAARGMTKAEGDYDAWGHNDLLQGTLVGRVHGSGPQADGNLIANIRVNFGDNGSVTIQIGGVSTPESRLNAGIWDGQCSGKFTEYDNVVPPPEAAGAAAIRSLGTARSFWNNFQR